MDKKTYKQRLLREIKGNTPQKAIRVLGVLWGGLIVKLYDYFTHNYLNEYVRLLRRCEYYKKRSSLYKIFYGYSLWRLKKISVLTGIYIPCGVCDTGMTLYHYGSIVVSGNAKIGKNSCIMNNVNIGSNKGGTDAPKIGDNVYIGPGSVIFGNIVIADNVYIGANSVVNKSILEPYSVVAGAPASLIKYERVNWWMHNGLEMQD